MPILDCLRKCCCCYTKQQEAEKLEIIYTTCEGKLKCTTVEVSAYNMVTIPKDALKGPYITWTQGDKSGTGKIKPEAPEYITLVPKGWRKHLPCCSPVQPGSVVNIRYQTKHINGNGENSIVERSMDGKHIPIPEDILLGQPAVLLPPCCKLPTYDAKYEKTILSGQKYIKVPSYTSTENP